MKRLEGGGGNVTGRVGAEYGWASLARRPTRRYVGGGPAEPVPLFADRLRQQGGALRARALRYD